MSAAPIIEVLLSDTGAVDYRLHPCVLNTQSYGVILATLARQIAAMMAVEGHFPQTKVYGEILYFLGENIREDEPVNQTLLQ